MVTALTCQNIQSREAVAGTGAIEDTGPGGQYKPPVQDV